MYVLSKPGIGDYVHVTGYADGSDWFIYDGNAHSKDCGLAGERFVWSTGTRAKQSRLRIFDAIERRLIADISLGMNEGNVIARVTARKGGNQLYAFTRQGLTACTLTVIETATGQILRRYEDLPLLRDLPAIQQSSGKLLYHGFWNAGLRRGFRRPSLRRKKCSRQTRVPQKLPQKPTYRG